MAAGKERDKLNPSGYVVTQRAFTQRFAAAMWPRFEAACEVELARQTDHSEPLMRINVDPAIRYVSGWDETVESCCD
jgi:hypothetical protein